MCTNLANIQISYKSHEKAAFSYGFQTGFLSDSDLGHHPARLNGQASFFTLAGAPSSATINAVEPSARVSCTYSASGAKALPMRTNAAGLP